MKSRHSQRLFKTKKRRFDLAVEVFCPFFSIVLRSKLLSHDLNATWWCVRLPSRDAKSMLNVATFLKTAVHMRTIMTTADSFKAKNIYQGWLEFFTIYNFRIQLFRDFVSRGFGTDFN